MDDYYPPPIEVIRERLEQKRLEQARSFEATRPLPKRPPPANHDEFCARVREGTRKHHSQRALQDPATTPLRRIRVERGLTLAEASKAAGVPLTSWWRAERETANAATWAKIAESLDVPLDAVKP